MIDNPFVTNGYAGPEYFCDRVDETAMLTNLLTNGNNVALMSPRRVGKTDLIRHSFQQESVKDDYHWRSSAMSFWPLLLRDRLKTFREANSFTNTVFPPPALWSLQSKDC